jgi:hypothetical protein
MADEWLQEYASSRGLTLRLDRPLSVIHGVKILGLESRNGRRYSPEALAAAAALYEGAKVNVNHPRPGGGAPRDYQDRLGSIREVRFQAGEGLFADLQFNPKHALAEQLSWDAEHAPENVGLSHNVEARTAQREGTVIVEAILKVRSVDLVADPATTNGLFESATAEAVSGSNAKDADLGDGEANALDEVTRLQHTVEELRHSARVEQHNKRANELARQRGLPALEDHGPLAQLLWDTHLREQITHAETRGDVERLVEERGRLWEAVAAWWEARQHARRPVSREQRHVAAPLLEAVSARQFVNCISRPR